MKGYVRDIDWINTSAMLYWSYPKSYKKDFKTEIKNFVFSGDYYGALKRDGYYQRLIKDEDGNCFMIARNKNVNGEPINKYEWVPQLHPFMESLPNGTVLLCECYLPGNEGSKKITSYLGCLKEKCIERQEKNQKLHFYIFDVCAFNGKNLDTTHALDRFNLLEDLSLKFSNEYVEWAKYYNGQELWDKLEEYLDKGLEGMVITRKDCPIYFKRTPARMTIKVKKEISNTIDCFFTGKGTKPTREYTGKEIEKWKFWEDIKTGDKIEGLKYDDYIKGASIEPVTKPYFYGWVGSLEIAVIKNGEITPIGYLSGLTDEIKADPVGQTKKVIEVTCMEVFEDTKALRHAKMVDFRTDKTWEECTWEQIFEK